MGPFPVDALCSAVVGGGSPTWSHFPLRPKTSPNIEAMRQKLPKRPWENIPPNRGSL